MINKKLLLSSMMALTLSSNLLLAKDKVYVTVDGENIGTSDVALILKDPRIEFDTLPQDTKKQILNQLVERKLLGKKALSTKVVDSKEYKVLLEDTIKTLKLDLALQVWLANLSKEIKVSDKEAKKYYNENKARFQTPPQFNANHILVKTEKEAQDIIDTLKKSKNLKNDFVETAKKVSIGPSKVSGGSLGWFTQDKMVPEFSAATMALKKGTITQKPVKTQFGYHIILLNDTQKTKEVSFDEIKNEINTFLTQEQFKQKLDGIIQTLKSKAKIVYK